jgi:hypothetical protein
MKKLAVFPTLMCSLFLVSCGSGNSSSSPPAPAASGVSQTYTATATAGEILTYTIDTNALTYSYKVIFSAYGLTNKVGSGTLTLNSDGSYAPSEAPNSKVYARQNGLLIGAVNLLLGGVQRVVPIVGVSNPISTASSLAGTYNSITLQCVNQSFGTYTGCQTTYGTIQVDKAGGYTSCDKSNIANGTGGCALLTTGTLSLLANGVWAATRTGSTNTNHFVAFTAPDGQNVLLIDLNDPGGYGYGVVVGSTQAGYRQDLADGTWYFMATNEGAGSLSVAGTSISDSFGNTFTATFDSPWTGMASLNNGGHALLAGAGGYAYVDPTVFELGMKK